MSKIDRDHVQTLLAAADSDETDVKGRAFEELVAHLFEAIPGVTVEKTNVLDQPGAQEIDVFLRNDQDLTGLPHLPHLLIVECKNWGEAVGSAEVTRLSDKIRSRGESFGILVTKKGITGTKQEGPRSAYIELLMELSHGRVIVVFEERELAGIQSGKRLADLLMKKWRELKTRRELYQATDEELNKPELRTGLREAIREVRQSVVEEFLEELPRVSSRAEGVEKARVALERLQAAVEQAVDSNDDPLWHGPRRELIRFGAAATCIVLLSDRTVGGTSEWLELAADVNGPDRVHVFVDSPFWRTLTAYYLEQCETPSEVDSTVAALALVQLAIDQVNQIDSIELEPEDMDMR